MTYPELLALIRASGFAKRVDVEPEDFLDTMKHVNPQHVGIDVNQEQYIVVGRTCLYMRAPESRRALTP